jgi:hypothetical protein
MPCIVREIDDHRIFIPTVKPPSRPGDTTRCSLGRGGDLLLRPCRTTTERLSLSGLTPVPTGHATPVPPVQRQLLAPSLNISEITVVTQFLSHSTFFIGVGRLVCQAGAADTSPKMISMLS